MFVLLAVLGSFVLPSVLAVAVTVWVQGAGYLARSVTVAEALMFTVPRAQLIVVVPVQDPWLAVGEGGRIMIGVGKAMVSVVPVATSPPVLVTVKV